jgi:quinol-cytochrome oxidoreductase complex cytochrome b subunit/mono/diheme cytochrome c family protein
MLKRFRDWLDHRTGYRKLFQVLLIEHIPGGAKWRYVWGSCLAFVFLVQIITGVLLMTAYSPGDSTAWASVFFIQYKMDFGWLIRGLHHFGSQTMVVLLGLHMLQVVIAGAHLPPREVNWWLGLLLMAVVLGLSLTGYLLPWDQKGYYATQVATNIAGNIPGIGSALQKFIVGGPEYGHQTLTRFYALHVGILPPLMIVLVIAHLAVFRRHGVTTPPQAKGDGWFWPAQAFKDMVVSLIIFGVMLGIVVWGNQGNAIERTAGEETSLYESLAHGGRDGRGANLDAPADPVTESYPARPEWYFLFLFQLLKYFPGDQETLATVVIPNGVGLLLFLLPLLGYGWMRRFGHAFGVLVVVGFLTSVSCLTYLALAADEVDSVNRWLLTKTGTVLAPSIGILILVIAGLMGLSRGAFRTAVYRLGIALIGILVLACGALTYLVFTSQLPEQITDLVKNKIAARPGEKPTEEEERVREQVEKFNKARVKADEDALRAIALADQGVPDIGGRYLLRNDPLTQGPRLFKAHCASCHSHRELEPDDKARPTASDLTNFGSKDWLLDFLRDPDSPRYFGRTKFKGGTMSGWARNASKKVKDDFPLIAEWLARHPRQSSADKDTDAFKKGHAAFEKRCIRCHTYNNEKGDDSETKGPDFTGYGDAEWIRLMVMAPDDPARYGRANRNVMPLFRNKEDGPGSKVTLQELARMKEMLLRSARMEVAEKQGKKAEEIDDTDPDFINKKKQIDECMKVVHLGDIDRELIIRWLRKDYRVVFGGTPIVPVK